MTFDEFTDSIKTVQQGSFAYVTTTTKPFAGCVKHHVDEKVQLFVEDLNSPPWGERISGTPIIAHKKAHYLQIVRVHDGDVTYTLRGNPVAKDGLGLRPDRLVCCYAIENIESIRVEPPTEK